MPIREELSLDTNYYESLDEGAIDVTQDRIDDARKLSMPFEKFRLVSIANSGLHKKTTGLT